MGRKETDPRRWAAKVCPSGCYTVYDVARRLDCTERHVRRLIKRYGIQTGLLRRPVRLADGRIVSRRLTILTRSELERLLLGYCGISYSPAVPNADPLNGTNAGAISVSSPVPSSLPDGVTCFDDLMQSLQRLRGWADEAYAAKNLDKAIACTVRASNLNLKLLKLCAFYEEPEAKGG